jgi:alpha-L-fucosidase
LLSKGEIWFDGGYQQSLKDNITALLNRTQPNAVAFGGFGVSTNPVRWIGTEAGVAPYPNWCTGSTGQGDPNSNAWVPAEIDTTLQNSDQWFYNPQVGLRDLATLQGIYHGSVGRNGNLLLDFAPQPNGLLPEDAMAAYRVFGNWIKTCYGQPLATTSGNGTIFTLSFPNPITIDRVQIMEDLRFGERVRVFSVLADGKSIVSGTSIGHKYIGVLAVEHVVSSLQLNVTQAVGTPAIRGFAAFFC